MISAGNRQFLRRFNTASLLNVIREAKAISHAEISRLTGLSPATVTNILKELKEDGFLETIGPGESVLGRKPTMLRFNNEARYVISGAFFADQTHVAVLDLGGKIKNKIEFSTEAQKGPGDLFERFAFHVDELIEGLGIDKEKILGVGVGFEGLVDNAEGCLTLSTRLGWRNVNIKEGIEKHLGLKTSVDSDGVTMAIGECLYGVGQGQENIVCVDIDAGIGSVEMWRGCVRRGAHYMAGEIGHTRMVPDGDICKCGRRGCLETVASGWAIVNNAKQGLSDGVDTCISPEVNSVSTRQAVGAIFDAAAKGDEFARNLLNKAGNYLGIAVAAVINYVDPEKIILTGCVIDQSRGMLLDIIKESAAEHVIEADAREIIIEQGSLGEKAALIGAAALVYEETFKIPSSN